VKERTKAAKKIKDTQTGDAYCFIGMERETKLVLAWHLGGRTTQHTDAFIEKLNRATAGNFQISTDGFGAYPDAIGYRLGMRTDFATLVKKYVTDPEKRGRYSPAKITGTEKTAIHGYPKAIRVCTSHIERLNLSVRMQVRRMTRLTNAFSKSWRNHKAALALFFAHYNWVRPHRSLSGCTPAMAADLAARPWSLEDLLRAAASHA